PASISNHVAGAVTYLFHPLHGYCAGNRTKHALKIRAHHAFILGIHGGSIHLVRLSICTDNDVRWMLARACRFVFEVNEMRRDEDKRQDQRHHYVVMEASPAVGPEKIALQRASNARHKNSLFSYRGLTQRITR